MLLENMTVVSKNPNYYTSELEAMTLANLQTKAIPRDRIKLQEEIGEGAFGKVFRGRSYCMSRRVMNIMAWI